jgi:hypothetical protein
VAERHSNFGTIECIVKDVLLFLACIAAACGGSKGSASPPPADGAEDRIATGPDTTVGDAAFEAIVADAAPPVETGGTKRPFPDTSLKIAILADQLPDLTAEQQQFVVSHFVGTQKLTLALSRPLRALKPDFLVLHYHLAMWQSAPTTSFILDGNTWSNDFSAVTAHESWFWHTAVGVTTTNRVASSSDGKLLMNVSAPGFQAYWAQSLAQQVVAGDYDGVFLDSASPALLQGECTGTAGDPRLAGTAACNTTFAELGGKTYCQAWEAWIAALDSSLGSAGIPLIPNTSAFTTTWDTTHYGLTAGAFVEGFADPTFAPADWKASTTELIKLVAANKIVILQNYLSSTSDLAKRRYLLANYLLVKGSRTYLDYFAAGPLEWYPEWDLDLGAAQTGAASNADELLSSGIYRRDFANGVVLVNPSAAAVSVSFTSPLRRVVPSGGGAVSATGTTSGSATTTTISSITVPAASAEILLR